MTLAAITHTFATGSVRGELLRYRRGEGDTKVTGGKRLGEERAKEAWERWTG